MRKHYWDKGDELIDYYCPSGFRFLTNTGWICPDGSTNHNAGGTVVEVRQSTSRLYDNHYNVELEPEVVVACKGTWWIDGKGVKPFNQDIWNRSVKHWKEYLRLKEKSRLEYVRMFRALKEENDEIEDEELLKEINNRQ